MVAGLNSLLNEALKYGGLRDQVGNLTGLQTLSEAGSTLGKATDGAKGDSLTLSDQLNTLKDLGIDLDGSFFGQMDQSFTSICNLVMRKYKGLPPRVPMIFIHNHCRSIFHFLPF